MKIEIIIAATGRVILTREIEDKEKTKNEILNVINNKGIVCMENDTSGQIVVLPYEVLQYCIIEIND